MQKKIHLRDIERLISDKYPDPIIQHFIAEIILSTPIKDTSNQVRFTKVMNAIYCNKHKAPKLLKTDKMRDEEILLDAAKKYLFLLRRKENSDSGKDDKDPISSACWSAVESYINVKTGNDWDLPDKFKYDNREVINDTYNRVIHKFRDNIRVYLKKVEERRLEFGPSVPEPYINEEEKHQLEKLKLSICLYFSNPGIPDQSPENVERLEAHYPKLMRPLPFIDDPEES